jgi:hypothetical protein
MVILSILSNYYIACGKYGFPVNNPEKIALALLSVISRNTKKRNDKGGIVASEGAPLAFPEADPLPQPTKGEMSRTARGMLALHAAALRSDACRLSGLSLIEIFTARVEDACQ